MNEFYVYGLYRPDEDVPFYIGKGRRALRSIKEYGSKGNQYKINIINKIKKEGKEPVVKILFENLTEEESFKQEIELIDFYERKDFGGVLSNMSDGGEGLANRFVTEETKLKMSQSQKGRTHTKKTKQLMSNNHSGKNNPMSGVNRGKSPTAKSIVAQGIKFDCVLDAAESLKVHRLTIGNRIRNKNFPDYYYN